MEGEAERGNEEGAEREEGGGDIQGYLDFQKSPPRRTLQWAYAQGPMVVLGG